MNILKFIFIFFNTICCLSRKYDESYIFFEKKAIFFLKINIS